MTERRLFNFRDRLTPEDMQGFQTGLQITLAQLLLDISSPGLLSGGQPVPDQPVNSWNVLMPPLTGYSRGSGQRIFTQQQGRARLDWAGDFRVGFFDRAVIHNPGGGAPLAYMPDLSAGQEQWMTLGVLFRYQEGQFAYDGFGKLKPRRATPSFQFRVVHGEVAATGQAERPEASAFRGGILLCDVLRDADAEAVTPSNIYYDRTEFFRWRREFYASAVEAGVLGTFPPSEHRQSILPGLASPSSAWFDVARFAASRYTTAALVRLHAVSSPAESTGSRSGDTILQASTDPTFANPGQTVSITLPQAANEASASVYLEVDVSGNEAVFLRVQSAGGHENVRLSQEYLPLELAG
ncbi:MAG: hypothetical protein RLY93_12395 [Sumerlaeia bacterium]